MRKTLFVAIILLSSSLANAQAVPDADTITTQYLIETGQLRSELGQTRLALSAAKKEVEKLKSELDKSKVSPQPEHK